MGYERYPRESNLGDYYNRQDPQDYGQDYGSGRDYSYSSAREYQAAGQLGRDRDRDYGSRDYGQRDYGYSGYGQRDQRMGRNTGQRRYTRDAGFQGDYRGSYASDGRRFTDAGDRDYGRADNYGQRDDRPRGEQGRPPRGYNQDDRGFFERAGDEVRSWFGDDEAERRREMDSRFDEREGAREGARWNSPYARDDDYHSWRRNQIAALDRDYDEYRRENRSRFENEFGNWRNERQTQRNLMLKVTEHMEVVGSDGEQVGTVDKVRSDRILLAKGDADAGGRHHSIPSRWIRSVDDKVTIGKTAEDAKAHWRDEERSQAFFGDDRNEATDSDQTGPHILNRSFSGTY